MDCCYPYLWASGLSSRIDAQANDFIFINYVGCLAQEEEEEEYAATADEDLGASREASRTDDEVVKR